MSNNDKNKSLPFFETDEGARRFTDEADLSEYDLSGFRPLSSFAFAQKNDARLEMRIPTAQLDALKDEAKRRGIPYTRLAHSILQHGISQLAP